MKNIRDAAALKDLLFKRLRVGYVTAFVAMVIAYVVLAIFSIPKSDVLKKYHLTLAHYRLLIFPIVLFVTLIWLVSLYGSLRFKNYAQMIRKSRDGGALDSISIGLLVLTLSLPLSASLSSVFNLVIKNNASLQPRLTIISNYVNVILLGAAFFLIFRGATFLQSLISAKKRYLGQTFWVSLFIVASTIYSYFLVLQPIHTPVGQRIYFLPDWLLLTTLAIPYLIIWYWGLNSAYKVYSYRTNVRGHFYKSALSYLAAGLSLVIVSSVFTEILMTVSQRLSRLSLTPILLIIYALLIVDAAGYLLIALGAKKLRRLEEV